MAFESLADKLNAAFKKLRGKGKLNESDIKTAMREVKMALLEADVNFKIVKDFIKNVSERSVGAEVLESLTPGQQVIKIVNEELIKLMGEKPEKLTVSSNPPSVYMLVGLQGAGKTTTCAKLAGNLRKDGKKPLLVACDVYRPAAIKQLQVVGAQLNIPVYSEEGNTNPVEIAKSALRHAVSNLNDVVIIDTAGRLHIDETLMDELLNIKESVKPQEILLTVDAMTGQDAVNVAESFHEKLNIDGVILTKLDGDTRGGAAISVRAVTGRPIKFAGMGEKLNELEPFYPDRMASRILGMGDVLTLIEKAEQAFDEKKAAELEKKMRNEAFTLEDFLDQMEQLKKMGPLSGLLDMIPGMNKAKLSGVEIDEKKFYKIGAIIKSMTPAERQNPDIINASRKIRIADGCGMKVTDVNALLKQFDQMKKMMKQFSDPKKMKRMSRGMKFPF